ncbi:beta-1,3-galactosyltransferase 5-like [Discoglossus pictus]
MISHNVRGVGVDGTGDNSKAHVLSLVSEVMALVAEVTTFVTEVKALVAEMARQTFIFAMVLFLSFIGTCVYYINLQFLDFCPFCNKGEEAEFLFDSDATGCDTDVENTTFLLIPTINCKKMHPFLVILVTTTHNQEDARMAIRQTWGKSRTIEDKLVLTLFLLGTTKQNKTEKIAAENSIYKDIIQKDFVDVYSNLTCKTLMGMEWISKYCPETRFVMKTDTDVFVNPFFLVQKLAEKNQTTNFFTGFLKLNDYPIRNISSKWYVNTIEFPYTKYPPFCSGTGYVFSMDVAQKIHGISANVKFFKLEDVYVGLCLQKVRISLQELHTTETFFPEKLSFSVCSYRNIVTSHPVAPYEILQYWEAMERAIDENCD